ncbi:1-aminocyclopropane-1-carboxylate deaminase/D-cysteine desulfhydrase [Sediminitomix flava]|uniref:1-aminocyclopropane-1-carboxylate deaminase n=1 Tax=Sediminitomix flava TaxID=379075 RepID=A0A315Z295_SEDFL|nr:pyridoxal-phosphate dependent enzyme [Sediminitomix flava]PWJ36120.1 1-aminocyclopropane-1-carboxylate deaminase [Sediminitomix flava]
MIINQEVTPIQELSNPIFEQNGVRLFIKRDDLNHPAISGNKLRKLKYNLIKAKEQGHTKLLTFGGAYSNHIYAVAAAGAEFGFETIAIIRGEEHLPLNPTLSFASSKGMKIDYMDRTTFRQKDNEDVLEKIKEKWGDFYHVPMGGSNDLAIPGVIELATEIKNQIPDLNYICTACGTGGTMAGIIAGSDKDTKILGFPALKGGEFLAKDIDQYLHLHQNNELPDWELICDYHFGGYAKKKPELLEFIEKIQSEYQIELEFIYTAKMLYGVFDLIKKGYFPKGSKIVAVHTGGLQINKKGE